MSFSADSALEYLQRAHKKNRLAHAYLISGPAAEFTAPFAHCSSRSVARDDRLALLEPASANRVRDRAFAAGNGIVALVMRDGGGKIARDRRGVSGFARNPGPAQFHSRADQGRTRGGLETRGNALPSYH